MTQEIIKEAFQTEIDIETITKQNGEYNNTYLSEYNGVPGLKPGEYITVNKHPDNALCHKFREGTNQWGKEWVLKNAFVRVGDKEYSIGLFNEAADNFDNTGGVGEPIQISKKKYTYVDGRGTERVKEELVFRKVE